MKIAFYIFSLRGGGAERVTTYLASYWAQSGHDVLVFTSTPITEDDYPVHPDVQRIPLILDEPVTGRLAPVINTYKRIQLLKSALKTHQPDYLLSMMTKASVAAVLACKSLSVPCLCAERNDPSVAYRGSIWHVLRKVTYRWAHSVVVQSTKADVWIRENTSAKRVAVIPNPVRLPIQDCPPFLDQKPYSGKLTLLAVGRLSKQKQFDHAIKAFAKLQPAHPQWQLIILGEGEERSYLENLVGALNMQSSIHLPGRAGNMGNWYALGDALILSSRYEGFPNVLVEAMGHGLAVVSYNCDTGPKDIIDHGKDGLLVRADDLDHLTTTLDMLMSNPTLRNSLSQAAKAVADRYTLNAVAGQWESLFTAANPPVR